MSRQPAAPTGLVPDANVLIDYANTDKEILSLIVQHVAPIYIPSPVLAEVRQLPLRDARRLGLQVVEPTLQHATEAASGGGGAISFQDRLCLITARTNGWICLTNDKPLRKVCQEVGVACMWGLEAMRVLVASGHLSRQHASTTEQIAHTNPFITKAILKRFCEQIGR